MRHLQLHRVALLGVVLLLSGCLGEPIDGSEEELSPCPGSSTQAGLDVSVWQGHIDWHRVAATKQFAIARAAYGTSVDSTFAYNYRSMRAEGMIRGSYQFFVPTESGTAQADTILAQIGTLGPGDLPPMLDVETDASHAYPSPTITRDRILAWKHRIEARTGRHPLIYTGAYFFGPHVAPAAEFAEMGLVIPNWSATCPLIMSPWRDWTMHQTTSSGSVSGISGRVDLDVFKGNHTALEALAGIHHCTPACDGTTIVEADCTRRACGTGNLCSTAGGVAPRCESTVCVTGAREIPTAHTTCINDTHLGHCSGAGLLTSTVCAAGTICMDDGSTASCVAPAPADSGVRPTVDSGVHPTSDAGVVRPTGDAGGWTESATVSGMIGAAPPHGHTMTGGCSVSPARGNGPVALVILPLLTLLLRRRVKIG